MPSLSNSARRFEIPVEDLTAGASFPATLTEPQPTNPPAFQFTNERRLLRVRDGVADPVGHVIRTPAGERFVVADHGYSESRGTKVIFRSYRLYEVTHELTWERRQKLLDPVTKVERDVGYVAVAPGVALGAYETEREVLDRGLRTNFEAGRFITNAPVLLDDRLGGRQVVRVDKLLSIWICELRQ